MSVTAAFTRPSRLSPNPNLSARAIGPAGLLLARDRGAGKTVMAGLFIKELIARGDLQRCLIVCPGSLAEQWQDELYRRFHLSFQILTNDKLEAARTGNWFLELVVS